jgi:hypothetical protein
MGFFGIGKKQPAVPVAAPSSLAPVDTMTHVKGVGRHQQVLAALPRFVKVELMPWQQGDTITVKINGERVGELDYSGQLHTVLAAVRAHGLPPVIVDGEVRRGDIVARYLAVALPSPAELKSLLPKGWAPKESPINIQMTPRHQDGLAAAYDPKGKAREAQVTFQTHAGGKFDGQPEGIVSLDGQVIGELSAGHDDKWSLIYDDRQAGIAGRLMVRIYGGANATTATVYTVDAVYKDRQVPADVT